MEVYKRQVSRNKKIPEPSPRKSALSKLEDPPDEYPEFDPWDADMGIYQDKDDSYDDRSYSFITKRR